MKLDLDELSEGCASESAGRPSRSKRRPLDGAAPPGALAVSDDHARNVGQVLLAALRARQQNNDDPAEWVALDAEAMRRDGSTPLEVVS